MYGHVRTLAEAEKAGIEKAGGTADLFQYASTFFFFIKKKSQRCCHPCTKRKDAETSPTGSPRLSPRTS